jgi:hypothetical protein
LKYYNVRVLVGPAAKYASPKINQCTKWLIDNVGERGDKWAWRQMGVIELQDEEIAIIFRLKFGI